MIINPPKKSGANLQEKNGAARLFNTSLNTWDIYDELTPDTGYEGFSKVGIKRIWPKGLKLSLNSYDTSTGIIEFEEYSTGDFSSVNLTNIIGIYIWAITPKSLLNSNDLIDGLFYFQLSTLDNKTLYAYRIFENQKDGTWTPNQNNSSFRGELTNDSIKLSHFQNVNMVDKNITYYQATLIYNKIE